MVNEFSYSRSVIDAVADTWNLAEPVATSTVDPWLGLTAVLLSGGLIDSLVGTLIDGLIGGIIDIGSDVFNPVCVGLVIAVVITLDDGESVSYAGDVPASLWSGLVLDSDVNANIWAGMVAVSEFISSIL